MHPRNYPKAEYFFQKFSNKLSSVVLPGCDPGITQFRIWYAAEFRNIHSEHIQIISPSHYWLLRLRYLLFQWNIVLLERPQKYCSLIYVLIVRCEFVFSFYSSTYFSFLVCSLLLELYHCMVFIGIYLSADLFYTISDSIQMTTN